MEVDEKVSAYFNGRLRQVFVYLTSRCQLRCRQCLYKPLLTTEQDDLSYSVLSDILSIFRSYGAFKLSFLGGEPTLYHDMRTGKTFADIVAEGKRLGYSIVRADTNGQFDDGFLLNQDIRKLDELTFSLDGSTAEAHDAIRRRQGVYQNCIARIEQAVKLGYKVQITMCVHKGICQNVQTGIDEICNMIKLCDSLGVHSLNFHPILKVGALRDQWIDYTEIEPLIWVEVYRRMLEQINRMKVHVEIRLPMRYIEKELYGQEHEYCPLKMGERILVMPDGQLKICAFHIGTPYCFARFDDSRVWHEVDYNECSRFEKNSVGCCTQDSPDGFQALCMSYKPNQNEAVWKTIREEGILCK